MEEFLRILTLRKLKQLSGTEKKKIMKRLNLKSK